MATFYMLLFLALSCLAVPAVLTVRALGAPDTLTVECTRASQTCRSTSRWSRRWSEPWTMSQLSSLVAHSGKTHALGWQDRRGHVQLWSGTSSDPSSVAALERGVATLSAFPGGTAPTVRVDLPNGNPSPPIAISIAVAAFGLFIGYGLRRAVTRSTLWIDRDARTVEADTRRALILHRHRSVPADRVRGVSVRRRRGLQFSTTILSVDVADEAPIVLVQEYTNDALLAEVTAAADRVASELGVPRTGGAPAR